MKTLTLILALAFATIATANNNNKYANYNRNDTSRIETGAFNSVDLSDGISLSIVEGDEDYIIVSGNKYTTSRLTWKIIGSTLKLYSDESIRDGFRKGDDFVHIKIYKRSLSKIIATNSCVVNGTVTLTGDHLTLDADLASEITISANVKQLNCKANLASIINFDTDSERIDAEANNVSTINGKGKCSILFAEANNASVCDLSYLIAEDATANANNASDTHISTTKSLYSEASNMGLIHHYETKNGKQITLIDNDGKEIRAKGVAAGSLTIGK